ncbi:MAG TPA: TlpA disulfide reductase family protein [Pyrinomonadaceae bacterium]|nr:TlpA disulfide reductase family protein [Pyrinomonadaceae bacterium]
MNTVKNPRSPIAPIKMIRLLVAVLLSTSVTTSWACNQKSADSDPTPVLSGPPSTTFPMPPLKANAEMGWALANGDRARLSDYRGKVLVLDFYATWCLPCRASIPRLVELQEKFGAAGLVIVGLNVGGPDDRIKVADFARELGIPYPLGFPDKSLTDLFLSDDQTIPQTFVFGRDGQLAKRFVGYQESTGGELEKVIESAVGQKDSGP